MKVQIVSDLHLEFLSKDQVVEIADRITYKSPADILILAGDICSWSEKRVDRLDTFLDKVVNIYDNVLYVLGNHEYYGCSYSEVQITKRKLEYEWDNLSILDNEEITIDSLGNITTFYGTTLWFEETVDTSLLRYYMNDYAAIRDFTPDDWSRKAIQFIKNIPDDKNKKVLITHHVPHSRFISDKYTEGKMNCFYLNEIGKYLDKFDLVTFGHSHESVDYQFSDRTKAISNPRGYLKAPDTCISYLNSSSSTEGSNDKFQYQLIVEV